MTKNFLLFRIFRNAVTFVSTITVLLLLLPVLQSEAQTCTFSNTGVNFGAVDLTPGTRIRTTGTFTATCTGTPGRRVRVCMNFGGGTGRNAPGADPRYMTNGANTLNYQMFKRGNYTRIWGSNVWPYAPRSKTARLRLNAAGTRTRSIPIRTEIYAGQAATPPGLYTSSFAGGHTLISYAYNNVGNCNVISGLGGVRVPFIVRANVLPACTVTANDLDFGITGILAANQDATNTISVNCTNLTPYSISLDGGLTGAADPTLRKLANGPEQVTYGIYQNAARSTPWGDTIGINTLGGTGTGSIQNYTAYGRVPTQITPTPGTYQDTIVVTVTY
ncbi:MAG: spore coat U domain-containing protein [Rhizobiaceae bacterium]|nr:spore coat U domain-containing protein [Rhizobiaceae bacterium]